MLCLLKNFILNTYKCYVRNHESLDELGGAAADVSKALNELLNHVKDSGPDKIPDIMDQVKKLVEHTLKIRLTS